MTDVVAAMLREVTSIVADGAIPVVIATVCGVGLARGVKVYEVFVEGAKEGFETAVRIIPYLVAVLVAVGMVRSAGLLDLLGRSLAPILDRVGIPAETLPMMLIRPLSGSGADGVMVELMKTHGADSLAATTAAVMSGASDTTFYVLAVYFGSVGIERIRHALWAGLLGDLAGLAAAAWMTRALLF
jgi:spore maturation protein B